VALKPATQKFKEKHGWTKILFRSGRLRASITGQGGTTGDSATIGSVLPYAQGQNDGATIIHPNRPGKTLHRYSKKTGQLLGFAKKNAKDGKRIGVIEMAFAGHAMNTAITLPARPYLVIQSEDVEQYTGILNRYWFEGVL
jgi:phage gpG-like protein